jgi:hypothetical protein
LSYHFTISFYPLRYFCYNRTYYPSPTNKIFRIFIYFSYYFISSCSPLYSLIPTPPCYCHLSLSDSLIHITLKLLHTVVHIFGIYRQAQQLPQVFTHLPSPLPPHSLLIGGFNARHPSWDPTHPEAAINHNGRFLRSQLDSQFLTIENDIFKPTHYPGQAQYHPTIIDLIISTLSMCQTSWIDTDISPILSLFNTSIRGQTATTIRRSY